MEVDLCKDRWKLLEPDVLFPPDEAIVDETRNDDFICPISLTVMDNPVCLNPCGHSFDYSSLRRHIEAKAPHKAESAENIKCPLCLYPISETDPFIYLPMLKEKIRKGVVGRCTCEGCEEEVKYEDWEAHMKKNCKFAR